MAQQERKRVDINIEVDLNELSARNIGVIINKVLEFLLHQRYQIPFNYTLFERCVESFTSRSIEENSAITKYEIQRQREQAKQTKDAIYQMGALVKEVVEQNIVKTVRFLFGSTAFTPREVYSVHIPVEKLTRNHYNTQQRLPLHTLNQIMLSLVMNEQLCNVFSNNLNPTTIYMDLELLPSPGVSDSHSAPTNMQLKKMRQLPLSCKDINLHIVHKPSASSGELHIYEDKLTADMDNGVRKANERDDESGKSSVYYKECYYTPGLETISEWWEAIVVVRGFKEKLNKKVSIW